MKMNEKLLLCLPVSAMLLIYSGTFALAQNASKDEYPKVEIFTGFSILGESPSEIRFGASSISGGTPARKVLKSRSSGTSPDTSASRETSRPISRMTRAAVPLPVAHRLVRQPLSSKHVSTTSWQARSLRPATAPALRLSGMRSPVWRARARTSRRRAQP